MMKLSQPFGVIDEDCLASFESEIGAKLPSEYRDFLLKHDGGVPELTKVILSSDPTIPEKDAEWTEVMHFYSIHPDAADDLSVRAVLKMVQGEFTSDIRFRPENRQRFIPVAQDMHGDLFVISLESPDSGGMFFVDYEEIRKLSGTFSGFMNSLIEYRDIWK